MGARAGNRSTLHMLLLATVFCRGRCLLGGRPLHSWEQAKGCNCCRERTGF